MKRDMMRKLSMIIVTVLLVCIVIGNQLNNGGEKPPLIGYNSSFFLTV